MLCDVLYQEPLCRVMFKHPGTMENGELFLVWFKGKQQQTYSVLFLEFGQIACNNAEFSIRDGGFQ